MVKINPSVTLELKDGQKITIGIDEAKKLVSGLARFIQDSNGHAVKAPQAGKVGKKRGRRKTRKRHGSPAAMSKAKKESILDHVRRKLSAEPQTLSNLLRGISYSPNHLPMIRQVVEGQPRVTRQLIGKRTYYSAKGEEKRRPQKTVAAAA